MTEGSKAQGISDRQVGARSRVREENGDVERGAGFDRHGEKRRTDLLLDGNDRGGGVDVDWSGNQFQSCCNDESIQSENRNEGSRS